MKIYLQVLISTLVLSVVNTVSGVEKMDTYQIYDNGNITIEKFKFPLWFKNSFFDLKEDLVEAREAGKRGIIVMLSQDRCSTCRAFIQATLGDPIVKQRVKANYDVIGMDIFSDLEVTDPRGEVLPVKDFAEMQSARLTPTILFYGVENALLLRIVGLYPPEKFQHVLDYVDGQLYSKMKISDYLRDKRIATASRKNRIMKDKSLFNLPAYDLASLQSAVKGHTLVLFEAPDCNPCKRFHEQVLAKPDIREKIKNFHAVQLDVTDDTARLITPDGRRLTPKQWYKDLELSYDVAMVFFDSNGHEVLRHDAETGYFRLAFTLDYVNDKGYEEEKQVLRWRKKMMQQQAGKKRGNNGI